MANTCPGMSRCNGGLALTVGLLVAGAVLIGADRSAEAKDPDKAVPRPAAGFGLEQVRVINDKVAEKWKENKLTPSPKCTDYEFIRRASLDIIGRIATPEEIRQYMYDPPATRRAQLIDRLLNSEDYARNWATIWTVWLMTRSGPVTYHEQMHLWLEEQFSKQSCGWDKVVTGLITATGKTSENGAVNFILANLGEANAPGDVEEGGQFKMVPATSRTARLFLGIQIQCTQCHNHPFKAQRKQKDFWETNVFYLQVERKGTPAMQRGMAVAPELTLTENPNWGLPKDQDGKPEPGVYYDQRNAVQSFAVPAFFLNERATKKNPPPNGQRRKRLAEYIVQSDQFPKAYVNRMWAHFFGKGMNTPGAFDDFGEDNQLTHPELLDYLAKEFKAYQFNPRELIRWICNSEAYSLSSIANKTNEKAETEPFVSRMVLKTMSPEQLFESLMVATQAEAAETREAKKKLREQWLKKLIVNFGDDEGNEVTFNGTVVQALILMNGKEINTAINNHKKGPVAAALAKKGASHRQIMDAVFLAVLNRPPTSAEFAEISRKLRMRVPDKDPYAPWQDLEWALINSNEFILNH